jgi:hypothetical protein
LSKREDVQGCASASPSMQQPTGVMAMMTLCNEQNLSLVSCEKITLFRHAILLPKIELHATFRSSGGNSITMLARVADQDRHKTGQQGSLLTGLSIEKTRKIRLKRHSLRHAA